MTDAVENLWNSVFDYHGSPGRAECEPGTITVDAATHPLPPDLFSAVQEFRAGKIEYRADAGGNIHAPVGRKSFAAEDLKANIEAVLSHLNKVKPATAKGTYMKSVNLSAQQTPAVRLSVA